MIKSIVVHDIPIDAVPAMEFVKPLEGLVSSFLLERPNDEFLRDLRAYTP